MKSIFRVKRYRNIDGGVEKLQYCLGFLRCLKRELLQRNYRLSSKGLLCWWVGSLVLYSPVEASFFGQQWIERTESGLTVKGDNLPVAGLLKEWCDLCHKQCVIDIDPKQKIALSLEKSDCETLYGFLSGAVSPEIQNGVYWFQKEPKGLWMSYTSQHRRSSEIASALKKLLSPMGKYEHVISDDATGTLWVPKRFYDHHQDLILSLDQKPYQYTLYLSWLRVIEREQDQYELDDQGIWDWLMHSEKPMALKTFLTWLDRHQTASNMTLLSEIALQLQSGEIVKTKLSELIPVERKDKKGLSIWKEALDKTDLELSTAWVPDGQVVLDIKLWEDNEIPNALKQASLSLENKVSLGLEESSVLNRFVQKRQYRRRSCVSPLSQIPFLGRLFCRYQKDWGCEKYILVASVGH